MLALVLLRHSMVTDLSDAELLRLVAGAGAQQALAEASLFERYAPRVRVYGKKHLKSTALAEDLTQQVMLKVLEAARAGRVEEPERLASFVFGTCRLIGWDLVRADQRQRKIEREAEGIQVESLPPTTSERDVLRLYHCMSGLAEREAQVVRMTYMEDREPEEIASRLSVSSGNVRVIRCRALAKLKTCLSGEQTP
jgi:RNA polymerase sigma-70 factor (ECF subfamily)